MNWWSTYGSDVIGLLNTVLISVVAMMQKKNTAITEETHAEVKKKPKAWS
jgi:hypothetical protein